MLVTESGILIDVKLEHLKNAFSPMIVTEFGISTDVKLEHSLNAFKPMLVTELPIVTDVKLELLGTGAEGINPVIEV